MHQMTHRLVSQRVEGGFLADQVTALQGNGSDVYWLFLGEEGERTAPLIERVLPVNPESEFGDATVQFVEEALPARHVAADETVWNHYLRAWTG
jgi:hypothetical protein